MGEKKGNRGCVRHYYCYFYESTIDSTAPAKLNADRLKGERIRDEEEGVMEFNSSGSNDPDCHRSNFRIYGWI
jgi:hypothetical protein